MARWFQLSLALALALLASPALAKKPDAQRAAFATKICALAESEAKSQGLEAAFFARLLWRESVFDPNVVSPVGAQGIAQFMPETAARRGLANPFDAEAAVKASAAYLSDLKKQFGNLGLAAAAYNAGEQKVADWISGDAHMPAETRSYVAFVTGHGVDDWKVPTADFAIPPIGKGEFGTDCIALASRKAKLAGVHVASAPRQPFGAVVAASLNEDVAMGQFKRLKLRFGADLANRQPMIERKRMLSRGQKPLVYVMLGEQTAQAATATCAKLSENGVPCLVRKN